MKKKITIAVLGAGSRGMDMYANLFQRMQDEVEIVAVAEPDAVKLDKFKMSYGIPDNMAFKDDSEFFAQPRLADGLVISTQDRQHYGHVMAALNKGYHIMLEKPISPREEECIEIAEKANALKRHVVVCHVLRYTHFYQTVKKMILSGKIGEVVSIQANEDVGFWHQAHSFVRGNWRNSETSAPMILAKCCHDTDIIQWLMDKKCTSVSSFGSNLFFNKEHAPKGSTERCLDGCEYKEKCPYDAEDIYVYGSLGIRNNKNHPLTILATDPNEEKIYKALREGPYGRCVFQCDNNVVDHQVVNFEFEGGATASLTMCAFNKGGRDIKVMGTHGFIYTQDFGNVITLAEFDSCEDKYEQVDIRTLDTEFEGHGGGDKRLVEEFVKLLQDDGYTSHSLSTIDRSIESHRMSFAAEKSRLNGGRCERVHSRT